MDENSQQPSIIVLISQKYKIPKGVVWGAIMALVTAFLSVTTSWVKSTSQTNKVVPAQEIQINSVCNDVKELKQNYNNDKIDKELMKQDISNMKENTAQSFKDLNHRLDLIFPGTKKTDQ